MLFETKMLFVTPLAAIVEEDWGGMAEAPFDWAGTLALAGAALFALMFGVLLVRSLLQGARYRAVDALDEAARKRLAAEIASAERETDGELAVVVLERSDRHPAAHWIAGALTLALGSALCGRWMPWDEPLFFFAMQVGFGVFGLVAALTVPGFRRAFVTEARADEMAQEQAIQEFYGHGLHKTKRGTGVLLFVSLFERRVVVLGGEGIDAKLDEAHWAATSEAVLDGIRAGSLEQGLRRGLQACAKVLTEHFPSLEDNPDEVPNHVTVRAE